MSAGLGREDGQQPHEDLATCAAPHPLVYASREVASHRSRTSHAVGMGSDGARASCIVDA